MTYTDAATTSPVISVDDASTTSNVSNEYNQYPIKVIEPQINVSAEQASIQPSQQREE